MSYNKKKWKTGDYVTQKDINNIENGIYEAHTDISNINNALGTVTLNTTDKTLKGAINELFQSVSNGKELLASALTDKGIPTLASESFEEIARKILSLGSGEVEELFNLITKNGDSLVTKNGDNLIYKGAM